MLEAKSMYLGGEIVSAADIETFEEPKQLGLICPFCSEALFINSGGVREKKGKLEFINPFFSHYKTGSDKFDCEKRSHSLEGRERIARLKGEARNQRLKLYNLYLWDMCSQDRNISNKMLGQIASQFGRKEVEKLAIAYHRNWCKYQSDCYTIVDSLLETWASLSEREVQKLNPVWAKGSDWANDDIVKQWNYFTTKVDKLLHRAICFEIIDFLGTSSSGYAFHKIFIANLKMAEMAYYPKKMRLQELTERGFTFAMTSFIAGTHWVDQIQKRLPKQEYFVAR